MDHKTSKLLKSISALLLIVSIMLGVSEYSVAVADSTNNGSEGSFNYVIDRNNHTITFTPKEGTATWSKNDTEWIAKQPEVDPSEYNLILGSGISLPDDSSDLFAKSRFRHITFPSELDTSNVTNMSGMFYDTRLKEIDLRGWDTSNVTDMSRMFDYSASIKPDVSTWDTSAVKDMHNMFANIESSSPDVSRWDTSNVTDMSRMFFDAPLANPDVSNWNTSKVTNMKYMFYNSRKANPDVSKWDTSNVTDMGGMFEFAQSAKPDVSRWNTSNVTNMNSLFSYATDANPDVSNWDTSNVTNMRSLFEANNSNPDVSNWNTSKVVDMSWMFSLSSANPDVSKWDTSNVTNMHSMFFGTDNANPDVSNWDISNVKNLSRMFHISKKANPDVSRWDTSNVTDMSRMFLEAPLANPDVSKWDTSKVTDMSNIFHSAESAHPDVTGWSFPGSLIQDNQCQQAFDGSAGLVATGRQLKGELAKCVKIQGSSNRLTENGFTPDNPNYKLDGYNFKFDPKIGFRGLISGPLAGGVSYQNVPWPNVSLADGTHYYLSTVSDAEVLSYKNALQSTNSKVFLGTNIKDLDFKHYLRGAELISAVVYMDGLDTNKLGDQIVYLKVTFKDGTYYENVPVKIKVVPVLNPPSRVSVSKEPTPVVPLAKTGSSSVQVFLLASIILLLGLSVVAYRRSN